MLLESRLDDAAGLTNCLSLYWQRPTVSEACCCLSAVPRLQQMLMVQQGPFSTENAGIFCGCKVPTSGRCCLWERRSHCKMPCSSWQGRSLSGPAAAGRGAGMVASTTALTMCLAPSGPMAASTTAPGLRAWTEGRSRWLPLWGRRSARGASSYSRVPFCKTRRLHMGMAIVITPCREHTFRCARVGTGAPDGCSSSVSRYCLQM